ncbi:hypothetical protein OIU74_010439 [Salix koriyanagi]|uniref:Uncharacterized protein n=1 Tax=Salix koriyanagi TaxID=2511006 RepID=A0A9Q0TCY6_9ROSI|nr:hypothetical protein OIU74_010439 [Salix koriyanagi]
MRTLWRDLLVSSLRFRCFNGERWRAVFWPPMERGERKKNLGIDRRTSETESMVSKFGFVVDDASLVWNWSSVGLVLEVQDYSLLGLFGMDCFMLIDSGFVMLNKPVLAHATMD